MIDKTAQFVAKNGGLFEEELRRKEQNNPKFSFLFGGPEYQYYVWKVNTLRAAAYPTPMPPMPMGIPTSTLYYRVL